MQEVVAPALQEMIPKIQTEVIADIKKEGHFIVPKDVFTDSVKKAQFNAKLNVMVKERTSKIVRSLLHVIYSYVEQYLRSTHTRKRCWPNINVVRV